MWKFKRVDKVYWVYKVDKHLNIKILQYQKYPNIKNITTMRTHLLTIGDEILIGQVIDTNTVWMAQKMMEAGFHIFGKTACGDTSESILYALQNSMQNADIILITGGLGPTKDDITKKVLTDFFGGKLVFHEPTYRFIEKYFEKVGRPIPAIMRDVQAMLPDNCEILKNRLGQAPGMMWSRDGKVVISMPGVPFEMQNIMEMEAIPRLKTLFPGKPIAHRTILTAGEGETSIARQLENFENTLPDFIQLAYLPALMQVRLRLTGTHADADFLAKTLDQKAAEIHAIFPHLIYGVETQTLEQVVGELLAKNKLTITTAESCTGGYLAYLITRVPGASQYFNGSLVTYSNEMKKQLLGVSPELLETVGAVSEEVVRQMAIGAARKFKANIAVAISGIAGPDGGTVEKPVGTVWIAVGGGENTMTENFIFGRDRKKNIEMTGVMALQMVRNFILRKYF
jgi:nicotinamide-nucleotide amidase